MKYLVMLVFIICYNVSYCCIYETLYHSKIEYMDRCSFKLNKLDGIENTLLAVVFKDSSTNKVSLQLVSLYELNYYLFHTYENFQSSESNNRIIDFIRKDTIIVNNLTKIKLGKKIDSLIFSKLNKLSNQYLFKKYFNENLIKKEVPNIVQESIGFILNRRFVEISYSDFSNHFSARVIYNNCKGIAPTHKPSSPKKPH
jgi:hypothetical protein